MWKPLKVGSRIEFFKVNKLKYVILEFTFQVVSAVLISNRYGFIWKRKWEDLVSAIRGRRVIGRPVIQRTQWPGVTSWSWSPGERSRWVHRVRWQSRRRSFGALCFGESGDNFLDAIFGKWRWLSIIIDNSAEPHNL